MCFGGGAEQGQIAGEQATAATGLRQADTGMYNNLSTAANGVVNTGLAQQQQYSGLVNNLLPQYETAAGIGTNAPQTTNPYQLTPAMQTQLNTQLDTINRQRQSDLAASTAHAAAQGITDPNHISAAQQNINEAYDQMANEHTAQFMTQAQQQSLANIQNLMGFGAQQEQQGTANALAGYGVQGEAAGGIGNIAGQTQEASNAALQASIQQNQEANAIPGELLSGAFELGGAAIGGQFGKGSGNSGGNNNNSGGNNNSGNGQGNGGGNANPWSNPSGPLYPNFQPTSVPDPFSATPSNYQMPAPSMNTTTTATNPVAYQMPTPAMYNNPAMYQDPVTGLYPGQPAA